jgi:hypothetical protein
LKKGGADLEKPTAQNRTTAKVKEGLIKHGYVTDDMLRLAQENNE